MPQATGALARPYTTRLSWEDLVLEYETWQGLQELLLYLRFGKTLRSDQHLARLLKPGYRALFYGPPGTGKSFTAALLGQRAGRPVYRVDLSAVVSKYIGETEKNLEQIFRQSERSGWILFFDEAESLFSRRTSGGSSNDRFANQEIGYLLQRIEDYPGLVLLATNRRADLDEAFLRRFQGLVHFPAPREEAREQLWKKAFSPNLPAAADVQMEQIAADYEVTGANITNIIRYCALECFSRDLGQIPRQLLEEAIQRELRKEGKAVVGRA